MSGQIPVEPKIGKDGIPAAESRTSAVPAASFMRVQNETEVAEVPIAEREVKVFQNPKSIRLAGIIIPSSIVTSVAMFVPMVIGLMATTAAPGLIALGIGLTVILIYHLSIAVHFSRQRTLQVQIQPQDQFVNQEGL